MSAMAFPITRMRRLRSTPELRSMVRETRLSPEQLILPLFVCMGENVRKEVGSMPGVFNLSVDQAVQEARAAHAVGVAAVILFGLPAKKDEQATGAWVDDGIVQRATRALKKELPKLIVMADVCLCEYMSHGHCGIVEKSGDDYKILNDPSLAILSKTALSLAKAGADIIAPSDMMDGRVAAIRQALDAAKFTDTPILSYAAKFASAFYGPFREAADSTPQFGDRRSYQMDGANLREAMREMQLDLDEGADMLMVKPAMLYLDVLYAARQKFDVPLAAYQVSGEYAMIQAAARNNWIDGERVMMESLLSIRRAGADMILTYFAKEAAKLLGRTL